jgi:hypothetical protein
MTDDATILAERVGQLETENKRLAKELAASGVSKAVGAARVERARLLYRSTVAGCVLAFFLLIVAPIYFAATTPRLATHCLVEAYTKTSGPAEFALVAVIEWGEDYPVGVFKTIDEAIAASAKVGCPVRPAAR